MNEQERQPGQQPPGEPPATVPVKKKKPVKAIVLALAALLAAYFAYSLLVIYLSPDRNVQQIYLVPKDAALIIQSSHPMDDWKKLNQCDSWKTLMQAGPLSEMAVKAAALDSIMQNNKTLLGLVGQRDMLISMHKTRARDFDFLVILDLQKTSKLDLLKEQVETIIKMTGSKVTQRTYNHVNIIEIKDSETREIMYMAFVDNHVAISYTSKLVEAAIDERHKPQIGLDYYFMEADRLVAGKGMYRVFINYRQLPQFMTLYLETPEEYIDMLSSSMGFAGLYLETNNDKIELKGHTLRRDTADAYVTALLNSGTHKMKAYEIMSARTAVYTHIGIDNPAKFVPELEKAMQANSKESYEYYSKSKKKIESFFGISLEENFISWMSGEFAIAQSEPGLLGRDPEYVLAIGTKDKKDARKNMEFIEKKIKNRTPVKIKSVEYEGYEIHYVEMKGFFRLFFGKMFDRFEKPYYTYLEDYVVFSNKPSTLLSLIEDHRQKNLLKDNDMFMKTFAQFKNSSTFFLYADMHKFFPQLKTMLNNSTRSDVEKNKDVLYAFPSWSLQVISSVHSASMQCLMNYEPYTPESEMRDETFANEDEEDGANDNDTAETEEQEVNELKRFYIEKFQGNVMREFYESGVLKSETEIKDGKRHGRHREYYENGNLKVRGKYSANSRKGKWRYYSEEGKLLKN